MWNEDVVANVTRPTLTIFKPSPELKNGTAVVIFPGGGFMALSIATEGTNVAKYLAAKGVTAFLLKYRIAHTGEDATEEFVALFADKPKYDEMIKNVAPLALADGLAAVAYVRQHASKWGISPDHVGIMGFSAGGRLPRSVTRHATVRQPGAMMCVFSLQENAKNWAGIGRRSPESGVQDGVSSTFQKFDDLLRLFRLDPYLF